MTVSSSTSVAASWKLPVVESRHGVIIGFKLSYKKKGPATIPVILNFTNGTVKSKEITGLDKYTEYEFQVLAYTYVGDGPKSHVIVLRTKEDGRNSEKRMSNITFIFGSFIDRPHIC